MTSIKSVNSGERAVCIKTRKLVFSNKINFTIEHQCIFLLLIYYVTM